MAFVAAALPALALGASVVGTGIDAYSKFQQGNYAGQVADNNAVIAKQNAEYARESGTAKAATESLKGASKVARITTAAAANGVDVNSGSIPKVRASQEAADTLDIDTILNNSELSAYGYTTQQKDFEAQGEQDRTSGLLGGIGTLVEGAASLSPKWGVGGSSPTSPGWGPSASTPAAFKW